MVKLSKKSFVNIGDLIKFLKEDSDNIISLSGRNVKSLVKSIINQEFYIINYFDGDCLRCDVTSYWSRKTYTIRVEDEGETFSVEYFSHPSTLADQEKQEDLIIREFSTI